LIERQFEVIDRAGHIDRPQLRREFIGVLVGPPLRRRLRTRQTRKFRAGAIDIGRQLARLAVAGTDLAFDVPQAPIGTLACILRLREFGLDHGINYREHDLVPAVREATGGTGVNLVVDPVGTTLPESIACLAYRGRAITVGNAGRGDRLIDVRTLTTGNQSLTGVYLGAEMGTDRVHRMIARMIDAVAAGALTVVIDRTFPLAEAAAAHAYIESRQAFGRVVLIP